MAQNQLGTFLNCLCIDILQFEDGGPQFGTDEAFGYDNSNPHASLEDLCRSHLVSIYCEKKMSLRRHINAF